MLYCHFLPVSAFSRYLFAQFLWLSVGLGLLLASSTPFCFHSLFRSHSSPFLCPGQYSLLPAPFQKCSQESIVLHSLDCSPVSRSMPGYPTYAQKPVPHRPARLPNLCTQASTSQTRQVTQPMHTNQYLTDPPGYPIYAHKPVPHRPARLPNLCTQASTSQTRQVTQSMHTSQYLTDPPGYPT